jgi:hypothetical protein
VIYFLSAKKNDFEKGLAQYLVEMKACRFHNKNLQHIDIYGIVTNSLTWRFYKFTVTNEVYESAPLCGAFRTNFRYLALDVGSMCE